jgi:hypothetical protein
VRPLAAILLFCLALPTACKKKSDEPSMTTRGVGYREVIPAEKTEAVAKRPLLARDTPVAVGETAPEFAALAKNRKTVIVFYRGHW